jgi:hypothetical protein
MRTLFIAVSLAALLAACQPPSSQQQQSEAPTIEQPQMTACNAVVPDLQRAVSVQESLAVASVASSLRGGRVAPGTYDLTAATRIGQPTGWQGARAAALEVTESDAGTVLNWVSAPAGGGDADRWTATLNDSAATPTITYTCGRMGDVAAEFTAQPTALTLRLPDGANGHLQLEFQRRS